MGSYPETNEHLAVKIDKKKGGKFQPFKKLFGKRKKKDTLCRETSAVKSHSPQCVSNGTFCSDEETLEENLRIYVEEYVEEDTLSRSQVCLEPNKYTFA